MRTFIVIGAAALLGVGGAGAQVDRMRVADPLGGAWVPVRIGAVAVPAAAEARLFFSGGSEFSTQAGCGNFGGFYSLEGERLSIRPRDPIHTGKCRDRASARLETMLAGFVASASTWALLPDGTLRIAARDGRTGLFRRVPPAVPALAGRWIVERIGAAAPPVPARIDFREQRVSAAADCNTFSARVKRTATGLAVTDGAATEMACDPARMALDTRLFTAVAKARRWVALPGGRVRLEGGGEPLLLRRADPLKADPPSS